MGQHEFRVLRRGPWPSWPNATQRSARPTSAVAIDEGDPILRSVSLNIDPDGVPAE